MSRKLFQINISPSNVIYHRKAHITERRGGIYESLEFIKSINFEAKKKKKKLGSITIC